MKKSAGRSRRGALAHGPATRMRTAVIGGSGAVAVTGTEGECAVAHSKQCEAVVPFSCA